MSTFQFKAIAPVVALGLLSFNTSCDGIGDLAEECGLTCPQQGILQGNAQISGIASIDAFFGAVIDVQSAAANVEANVRTSLDAIAISVGLPAGSAPADVRAALEARFQATISGGISVRYQPAECSASVEVTAKAAAECDVDVDPGSVEVRCEGSCEADVSAEVMCEASATLVCEFTPPDLQCEGSCEGSCYVEGGATCEGTCRGECDGECTVLDNSGQCAGQCMGTCEGTCELSVAAMCEGSCEGTCTATPPSGMCEAGATAKCQGSAEASVACEGKCEGKATPPNVKAECDATVEAKASASIECTPPSVQIDYQFAAGLDAEGQAQFKAWLTGFRKNLGIMIAANAKAGYVLEAGNNMIAAAGNVVASAASEIEASGDLKASIGAGCALDQLGSVGTALRGATDSLTFSVDAFTQVGGAVGLGS